MAKYTRLNPEEKAERLELCFQLLVETACAGARCPKSDGPDATIPKGLIPALALQGRILVEISGHNWRQVTILEGPHAGKKTAAHPNIHSRPYIVMSRAGTTRNPGFVPQPRGVDRRRKPTLPEVAL